MVSSGTIWASEVRSSSDQTEFVHAREIAKSYLVGLHAIDTHAELGTKAAKDFMSEDFDAGWLSPRKTEVFIASFSSAPDRKSQWECYSDRGRGVAVVVNLTDVRPPADSGYLVTLALCVYDAIEKERLIEYALHHVIKAISDSSRKADCRVCAYQADRIWPIVDRIYEEPFDQQALYQKQRNDLVSKIRIAKLRLSIDL